MHARYALGMLSSIGDGQSLFISQHQLDILVSPLRFPSIFLCLQQQINMALKHVGTAAVTHEPRSPKLEGRWPEVQISNTVCILTSCRHPTVLPQKQQQKRPLVLKSEERFHRRTFFFLAQCNQMMSVSTQLVSFTVQKIPLYTGITVGTEGVKKAMLLVT